ncbi:MAG: helix-turn-helix domain-containing protein [Phycisphaerales bacterium]
MLSVDGDRVYVLVPVRDFRKAFPKHALEETTVPALFSPDEINDAVKQLDDPNAQWIDSDDAKAMLAAADLVKARKARGLTQKQLGDLIGVPQSQISRIERNPDRTTVRTIKKIAKALRLDAPMP